MERRQQLVLGVLGHFLQETAESFAITVCSDAGLDWEILSSADLVPFSKQAKRLAEPILGRTQANFISGVIKRLQERGA